MVKCDKHNWAEITLNRVGDYLIFPSMCYHRGFFSVTRRKTLVQAQLFAMHSSNPDQDRLTRQTTKMSSFTRGRIDRRILDVLMKDLVGKWKNTAYSQVASRVCSQFNGEWVQRDKNRHIFSEKFALVPKLQDVVTIFESEFPLLQVDSVWLLKKEYSNDGFQTWHQDFKLGSKITATIVVNLSSYRSTY